MGPSPAHRPLAAAWVILTTGDRPTELAAAVASIRRHCGEQTQVLVASNGAPDPVVPPDVDVIVFATNLGIPEARDRVIRDVAADVVICLDDDAEVLGDLQQAAIDRFTHRPDLGAVSFRLVDEQSATARRHVPRPGRGSPDRSGDVVGFLGGACAVRRDAYVDAGGFWGALFYGHEELDLSWRLIDHGWSIEYLADAHVFHPRTPVGRHAEGWLLTGRNRVAIARRNLPLPIAAVHVVVWLVLGTLRARRDGAVRAYWRGWWSGWRQPVDRRPIGWRTVARLTRLGRPPVV